MSYYRSPDDLPEADQAGDAAPAPDDTGTAGGGADLGWTSAPASFSAVPAPPALPIAAVEAAARADAERQRRKRLIIGACVAIDVVILVIVLAIFAF